MRIWNEAVLEETQKNNHTVKNCKAYLEKGKVLGIGTLELPEVVFAWGQHHKAGPGITPSGQPGGRNHVAQRLGEPASSSKEQPMKMGG